MATRFCESAVKLERELAAKVKGMLARGDSIEDIAVWFGISERVVQAVQTGAVHPQLTPAPADALPPPGPYNAARMGYRALDEVRAAERRLHAVSAAVRNRYHRS
jgi:hypothetical protein